MRNLIIVRSHMSLLTLLLLTSFSSVALRDRQPQFFTSASLLFWLRIFYANMKRMIMPNSLKRFFSIRRHNFAENISSPTDCTIEERNESSKILPYSKSSERPKWKCFSYDELYEATSGFGKENLVGKGGCAEVYKGTLKNDEKIAVKRLSKSSIDHRKEKEFLTEIGTMGHVNHPNVLSLLGCCIDNGLYLIFELSSRGSVASLLHEEKLPTLDWKTRYKVVLGTASGLNYLHNGCQRRIIHRDIKASNILLTEDFEPRISDFGLAKWLPSQWTHHSIAPIEGTFGHLAPEYYMHGIVDEKTDVFAFGVFILEVISGRKAVDKYHQTLHTWAKPILKEGKIEKLVDPRLEDSYDAKQLKRLAFAASQCIMLSSTLRPTMTEVLRIMEEGHEVNRESWKILEEELEQDIWGFEDLDSEYDISFSLSIHL